MVNINGTRTLEHSPEKVFAEGLISRHWDYDENGLTVQPRDKQKIAAGGVIYIALNVAMIDVGYDATVTDCIENEHVAIKGHVPGFGDTSLTFDLEENDAGFTEVSYGFKGDFNKIPKLGRCFLEKTIEMTLEGKIENYADKLTEDIDEALRLPHLTNR